MSSDEALPGGDSTSIDRDLPPRTFVIDTNVLLYDPNALGVFEEHDVVIPMTVIEEIDRFKKDLNETGRNARYISRLLDTNQPSRGECTPRAETQWSDARIPAT